MRLEQVKNYLATNQFAVSPQYLQSIVDLVNSGEIAKETNQEVAQSHSYDVQNGVAVIAVDGATTKKNTWMNAMCGGFIGYDTITGYVNKAIADDKVHTILLLVDTHGGDVAGVDELAELVFNTEKKTVTLYVNVGASAGIWWGSASDFIYANKTAELGSIGVMGGYYKPDTTDDKKVVLVSRNAENKNCLLKGNCKKQFQSRIDSIESIFHDRVSRNTGLTQEEIVTHFNNGGTITADKALEIGFLDGITTFDVLVRELSNKTEATPPSQIVNSSRGNGSNSTQGQAMTAEEKLAAANSTIETMTAEMGGKDEKIATLSDKNAELLAQVETLTSASSANTEAVAVAEKALATQAEIFNEAIKIGFKMGANEETMLLMAKADSKDGVASVMLNAMTSGGVSTMGTGQEDTSKENAENIADRASNVGITILGKV